MDKNIKNYKEEIIEENEAKNFEGGELHKKSL